STGRGGSGAAPPPAGLTGTPRETSCPGETACDRFAPSAPTRGARSFLPGRGRGGRPVLLQRPAPPSPGGRGRSPRLVPPLPAEAERLRVRLAGERPLPARRPGVASGCSRRSGAPETTPPGARTAPACSTPATSSLPRRGREGVRPPFPAGKGG